MKKEISIKKAIYTLEELDNFVNIYTKERTDKVIEMFHKGNFPPVSKEEVEMVISGQYGKATRRYRDRNKIALYQAEIIIDLIRKK